MYEYVDENEYSPAKKDFESIIRKAQNILRTEKGITFQPKLVGSAGRHLITRLVGGNKGFDLDYNLVLKRSAKGYDPGYIRDSFLYAFQIAVKGTKYRVENSTSAITIKYINKKVIVYSCDLAVIDYYSEFDDDGYYINRKRNGRYVWELRGNSVGIQAKIDEIKEWNSKKWWKWIKDEYLVVKDSNKDPYKHSFSLYNEAVCNVYNQVQQVKKEEAESDVNVTTLNYKKLLF